MFVENSMEGELPRRLRGVVERIQHILKFRVKVVERAGTPLRLERRHVEGQSASHVPRRGRGGGRPVLGEVSCMRTSVNCATLG